MKYEYFWRTRRNIDSTLISDLWRKKQDSLHPPWKKEEKAVAYLTSKPEWWLLPRRGWYQCLSLSITTHSAGVSAPMWVRMDHHTDPTTDLLNQNLHIEKSSLPWWLMCTVIYIDLLSFGTEIFLLLDMILEIVIPLKLTII